MNEIASPFSLPHLIWWHFTPDVSGDDNKRMMVQAISKMMMTFHFRKSLLSCKLMASSHKKWNKLKKHVIFSLNNATKGQFNKWFLAELEALTSSHCFVFYLVMNAIVSKRTEADLRSALSLSDICMGPEIRLYLGMIRDGVLRDRGRSEFETVPWLR